MTLETYIPTLEGDWVPRATQSSYSGWNWEWGGQGRIYQGNFDWILRNNQEHKDRKQTADGRTTEQKTVSASQPNLIGPNEYTALYNLTMRISESRLAGIKTVNSSVTTFPPTKRCERQITGHSKQKTKISKIHWISEENQAGWMGEAVWRFNFPRAFCFLQHN